jgi:signal transduction histidine kinase/CheY-like chemotaxis protein
MNRTLLLADDNATSLKLLRAIFEVEGYHVLTANDGKEAYDILLGEPVDLVISDILMPNIDGYYLCYKIRTHKSLKHIPIIIYTATFTSKSEEKVAHDMGANRFIRKPASLPVLLEAVEEVLANPILAEDVVVSDNGKFEVIHEYSSGLVNKLEQRSVELEDALDSLKRTVDRFQQAQQIGHLGHWEYDFTTKRTFWSHEMYNILGLPIDSVKPSLDLLLKYVHKEDKVQVRKIFNESIKNSKPFTHKHRIVTKRKFVKHLLSVGQFEFAESLKPLKIYGISLDITELSEQELKLQRANRELETFIYKAYHDLRSPIVTVEGLTNLAEIEVKDEVALSYFKLIGEVTRKQNRMLLKLTNVMNIRSQDPEMTTFLMGDVISEVLQSLSRLPDFKRFKIKVFNQLRSPISSDRNLVTHIVHNLVENSLLYYDLDRSDSEITITVDYNREGNIIIEVEDNGIGIPEEVKRSVFDLFFRGTATSKGAGLGLFLVRNAVDKLNGSVNLTTYEGLGSTFTIILPTNN